METQLLKSALGDCTRLTVLDLGGGTGVRARQILDAGATSVDVVDLTPGMMRVGQDLEASLDRSKINWYEGDATKPLDHLPLQQYDLVMVNWLLDHAANQECLEAMWQNATSNLKSGGRFVGVRSGKPRAPAFRSGKYGSMYKDIEPVPGGVKVHCTMSIDPPFEFGAVLMEASYSGSTDMHSKYGLEDIQIEPFENAECIGQDPEFWAHYLEDPPMVVVKARKRSG